MTGQNYVAGRGNTTPDGPKGNPNEQTVSLRAERTATTSQATTSPEPRQPALSVKLDLNVLSEYGTSSAEAVHWALRFQQESLLKIVFNEIKRGDHEAAFDYFSQFEDISEYLFDLTHDLILLAHNNYKAAEEAVCSPATLAKRREAVNIRKAEEYTRFLALIGVENDEATDETTEQ